MQHTRIIAVCLMAKTENSHTFNCTVTLQLWPHPLIKTLFLSHCSIIRNGFLQCCTDTSEIYEPPQNSRFKKPHMKQIPNWGPIKYYSRKTSKFAFAFTTYLLWHYQGRWMRCKSQKKKQLGASCSQSKHEGFSENLMCFSERHAVYRNSAYSGVDSDWIAYL
jgi:hypothetical protein